MNREDYALITGATSGFGYEFAKLFAQNDYNLVLIARNEDRLIEVSEELQAFNVDVRIIKADLFEPSAAENIYNAVKEYGIKVSVLVNNAGQGEWGNFIDTDLKRQLDIIQLNINSLVSLTYYFLKDMVAAKEGKILQLGSVFSKTPAPLMSVYAATKAFILSFSHSIMNEIENTNVTMTLLMPGASDTDFFFKAGQDKSKVYTEGNLSNPVDVARDGFVALMSGESSVISGFGNKIQGIMSDIMPEQANAVMARKQNELTDKPDSEIRTHSEHGPSLKERRELEKQNKK
jgi:short-subunit dehydrogenase